MSQKPALKTRLKSQNRTPEKESQQEHHQTMMFEDEFQQIPSGWCSDSTAPK
jgi:hypothetical protein